MPASIYTINNREYRVLDTPHFKRVRSEIYNLDFMKVNGFMKRWGRTAEEDTKYSPIGPEILDIEISVNGCPNKCPFCYKSNSDAPPTNMSFKTFKKIIDKFPKTLTQVAFGITGVQTNPEFLDMLCYCRFRDIVPNFTLSGVDLTPHLADEISKYVGAVAVSVYGDKNLGYNTVNMFTSRGVKQTNIHLMVARETLEHVFEVLRDSQTDPRLKDLNAIVFLSLKPKGRGSKYHPLIEVEFLSLVQYCVEHKLSFGFDSCSAYKFQQVIDTLSVSEDTKRMMRDCTEPCESSLFSSYVNVKGEYWNCSFCEGNKEVNPVDVLKAKDFLKDVWYNPSVVEFRNRVLKARDVPCPVYNV